MSGGTLESMYVCMCVGGGGLLRLEPNERSFKDSYWKYYFLEFYKIKKTKQNTQLRWGKRGEKAKHRTMDF